MSQEILLLSLLVVVLLISNVMSSSMVCDTEKTDIFKYESVVSAFGGPAGEGDEQKREEFTIAAFVGITCVKKFHSKEHENEVAHLNVFEIQNATLRMKANENWNPSEDSEVPPVTEDGEYDAVNSELEEKLIEGLTYYIQSENGKVYSVYHPEDEDSLVTNMKKAIIQELQTKMKGETRIEETTEGLVKNHYERAEDDDGNIFVQKKASTDDVLQDAYQSKHNKNYGQEQHRMMDQESNIAFSPEGRIQQAITEKSIKFGQHSKRSHEIYEVIKSKVGYQEGGHSPNINDYMTSKHQATLTFMEQVSVEEEIDHSENVNIQNPELDPHFTGDLQFEDDFSMEDDDVIRAQVSPKLRKSTLMSDDDVFETVNSIYRKRLKSSVDLSSILRHLHETHKGYDEDVAAGREYDSDNLSHVASAQHFCLYLPEDCLEIARKYFDGIDNLDHVENHSISHILQSLYAASQSEAGQEALIESMKNVNLIRHGILRTLDLNNPSKKVIDALKAYADGEAQLPEDTSEEDRQLIQDNAYMAYADAAHRSEHPEHGDEIVDNIINNLSGAKDIHDVIFHVHALGNAGEAVPVEYLKHIITSPDFGDYVKDAAIDALRKHTSVENDAKVTRILHNVIGHPKMHPLLKNRAVKTLTTREVDMPSRAARYAFAEDDDVQPTISSVQFLERFLYDPDVDDTLKKSILEYFYEEGSYETGELLKRYLSNAPGPFNSEDRLMDIMPQNDNDKFLRLRRTWRRVRRRIRRFVRRVGRVVRNVATGVSKVAALPGKIRGVVQSFKGVFRTAHFKGQQVCTVMNVHGSRLCAYDQDMISFIQKQGDLSNMKHSKQFSFEKLLGTEGLHAYVGAVAGAYSSVDCALNQLDLGVFGRVNAHANILSKTTQLITGEVELSKRTYSQLTDRVYLKVFRSVLVNRQMIPNNVRNFVNKCDVGKRQSLVYKNYPNLVNIDIIIPVIIPISIQVGISAEMGVDFVYSVCPGQMQISAGVEPYVGVGVYGGAGISIFVASGTIGLTASLNYRLKPSVGTENCKLCAKLDHEANPLSLSIGGHLKFLWWHWDKKFVEWSSQPISGSLFKYCLNFQQWFTDDDDRLPVSPNIQYWEKIFADTSLDEEIYSNNGKLFA